MWEIYRSPPSSTRQLNSIPSSDRKCMVSGWTLICWFHHVALLLSSFGQICASPSAVGRYCNNQLKVNRTLSPTTFPLYIQLNPDSRVSCLESARNVFEFSRVFVQPFNRAWTSLPISRDKPSYNEPCNFEDGLRMRCWRRHVSDHQFCCRMQYMSNEH